jgi:AcrR family transcriptional regulator
MPTKKASRLVAPTDPAPAQDARQRLLAAALAVLREEGFHALTQTRVAVRCGLRQSHLTYYFPRRADLLMAVAEVVAAQVQASVAAQADAPALDLDGLRRVLRAQLADREVPRLMLSLLAAADEDPRLRDRLRQFHAGIAATLRGALARAGLEPPEDALALFHASLIGLRIGGLLSGAGTALLVRLFDLALDRLLEACAAAAPPPRKRR